VTQIIVRLSPVRNFIDFPFHMDQCITGLWLSLLLSILVDISEYWLLNALTLY